MKLLILSLLAIFFASVSNASPVLIEIPEDTIILHWENHCPIDQVESFGYSASLEAKVLATLTCNNIKYYDVAYVYGGETHFVAVNANDVADLLNANP